MASEGTINFCDDPTGDGSSGTIDFCEEPSSSDGTINFCAECENLEPLTITGTDAPSVGSGYSAAGGKGPYTWSISCGAIDDSGQITDLSGCCGTGSVTVRDDCGNSASIEVRFPNGGWNAGVDEFTDCQYPAFVNIGTCTIYSGG